MPRRPWPGLALVLAPMLALTASCGASQGPRWPKSAGTVASADWTEDGGESLAPRGRSEAAAVERAAEPTAESPPSVPAATAATNPEISEPTTVPDAAAPEELQIEEEIIIEITD